MTLRAGSRLGPYEIVAPLGAGGMGEVYRAKDPRLGREVAIKVLPADVASDAERLERFEREARATAALSHPNILAVHDVGTHDGVPYLVEELLEGESLLERLALGALPLSEAVSIAVEIARGLAAAHERGIVHRDLKPGNVFLTRGGAVKLLDFGLAKLLVAPGSSKPLAEATTLAETTALGVVLGTVAYMAPEQARGVPVDARADVFALGVVLYELLAGKRPFGGSTATETLAAILKDQPPALPRSVPAPLAALVARCLEKDPARRYGRGGELLAALEAVRPAASGSTASWHFGAIGRPGLAWGAKLLLLLLVALFAADVGGLRTRVTSRLAPPRAVRLAVLPFANLTGDPEQEYLSDGLTQEMIAQLGRLHPQSLSVIARTSVMRYKRSDIPIDQIGRELGVDYVLEGSARREGARIRVSAELIRVRDQSQLWAESYEREQAGILALESEVARAVADALALRLLPAERARLASTRAVDPEAHDAYLKGLHHFYGLEPEGLDTALRYFELARQEDPGYALPYVGISLVWAGRNQIGAASPSEAGPRALEAAERAVALDGSLAESHYALALARTWHTWDFAAADAEWRRAIELDPSFPDARAFYSHYLYIVHRPVEAREQSRRALELDPFNPLFQVIEANNLLHDRKPAEALRAAREILRSSPGHPVALAVVWMAVRFGNDPAEILAAARSYYAVYGDRALDDTLARGSGAGGNAATFRAAAALLAERSRSANILPMDVADLYLAAADPSAALDWLERAYELRDPNLPYISAQPIYDPIRREPRFQALLRRMKLPES